MNSSVEENSLSISYLCGMVVDLEAKHKALLTAVQQHGLTEEVYDSLLRDAREKLAHNQIVKAARVEVTVDGLKDMAEALKDW